MDATLHYTIREALRQLVRGEIDLATFREWFGPVLWSVEESKIPPAIDLAYEISGLLAEYSHGHWTAEELIAQLSQLSEAFERGVSVRPVLVVGGGSAVILHNELPVPSTPALPPFAVVPRGQVAGSL